MKSAQEDGVLIITETGRANAFEFIETLRDATSSYSEGRLLLIFDARGAVFEPRLSEQRAVSTILGSIQKTRGIKTAVVLSSSADRRFAEVSSMLDRVYGVPTRFFEDLRDAKSWIVRDEESTEVLEATW